MGLKAMLVNRTVKGYLRKSFNPDRVTTLLGGVVALVMASNVDFDKLFNGDIGQISLLIAALAVAGLGWLTNKVGLKLPPEAEVAFLQAFTEASRKMIEDLMEKKRKEKLTRDAVEGAMEEKTKRALAIHGLGPKK